MNSEVFTHSHLSGSILMIHSTRPRMSELSCGKFNSAARWPKNSSCNSHMLDQQMNQCKSESLDATTLYNTGFFKLSGRCKYHTIIFSSEVNELPVTKRATVGVVFITKTSKMYFPIPEKVFCSFNLLKYSPVYFHQCSFLVFNKKLIW